MNPVRSIVRNSSILVGAQVVAGGIGTALVVALSRGLGTAEFGRLHLALTLTMLFGVAVECGLTQVVARAVARDRTLARPYLRSAVWVMAALSVVAYAALLKSVDLLGYPAGVWQLAAILGAIMVFEATAQVLAALFQAHEQMVVPAVARIAGNAFTLAVVVPLMLRGHGAQSVAVVMVLAALLRVTIQCVAVGRLAGFQDPAAASLPWRRLVRAGLPFLVAQGLGMLVFRMDVVMLGRLASAATIGWYGAASRLVEAFIFVPHQLTAATFPVAARLWHSSPEQFRGTVRTGLHLLIVIVVPIAVMLFTLADGIVGLLFTLDKFGPSVPILRIQALSLILMFVTFYLIGVLMAIGRERAWLGIAAGAAILNPALNWVLIPMTERAFGNGGIGAALVTLTTEVFILGAALRQTPRGMLGRESWDVALRAAGSGGLLAVFLLAARAAGVPWVLAAGLGGLGYLALVLRAGLLSDELTASLRELLTRGARPGTAQVE